ncbi:MAG: hypothetical protein N4A44_04330 [Alphaproteobacteria bacterium]|jgi:hypothetical protein|nr:hypothetical protein [Alphaproteobacteria bacterium]
MNWENMGIYGKGYPEKLPMGDEEPYTPIVFSWEKKEASTAEEKGLSVTSDGVVEDSVLEKGLS